MIFFKCFLENSKTSWQVVCTSFYFKKFLRLVVCKTSFYLFLFYLLNLLAVKGAFDRINRVGTKIAMEQKQGNVEAVLPLCLEFRTAVEAAIKPPHNFYVMAFRSYFKSNWILKGSVEKMQQ